MTRSPLEGRLHARLAARFRLAAQEIRLPRTGLAYTIYKPAAFDPLLDATAADPEQNLPYWAVTWPSGIALADTILSGQHELRGRRVLELGCGLGVTAAAAVAAGADLSVTDYATEALLLCRLNALHNAAREPRALQLNWRSPSSALFKLARPRFPIVLAADVLYESRDIDPLLALIDRLLAPAGQLWLAEPQRPVAQRFVAAATRRGWHDEFARHHGPWPDPEDAGVVVDVHRLRRQP